jgi:hypothetical protein
MNPARLLPRRGFFVLGEVIPTRGASGVGRQQFSRTVLGLGKDDRIFVLAWQAPETPAQPAGVALQAVAKRLTEAKAFEAAH